MNNFKKKSFDKYKLQILMYHNLKFCFRNSKSKFGYDQMTLSKEDSEIRFPSIFILFQLSFFHFINYF